MNKSTVRPSAPRPGRDLASVNTNAAARWHPTKNGQLTPVDVSAGSSFDAWWKCQQGHEWRSKVSTQSKKKSVCWSCYRPARRQTKRNDRSLLAQSPHVAAQWHPTKNGELTPRDVTFGSARRVWWLCSQGHEYEQIIRERVRKSYIGCSYCSGHRVLVGCNDLDTTHPLIAAQWHPTKNGELTPRDVTAGTNRKVWWLCPQGHDFDSSVVSRTNQGTNCFRCRTNMHTSYMEEAIRKALRQRGECVEHRALPVVWGLNGHRAHCDVVLPTRQIVVEYDGSYWHRNRREPDLRKTRAMLEVGWGVIRIRENNLPLLGVDHPLYREFSFSYRQKRPDINGLVATIFDSLESFYSR